MYIDRYVKYPLFFHILMKLEFPLQIFEKFSNIKFHENLFIGSRGGRTDGQTDTWTRMTKFIVAFRDLRKRLLT